jgi:hypothetical protein
MGLALSKGTNNVGASLLSPYDGNRYSFGNVVIISYLELVT